MNASTKKWLVGIVIIVVVIILIVSATGKSKANTIKIGIVAPLTGGGSIFGNSLADTMKIAVSRLSNTKYTYQLVIEDDATDPGKAATAAQKLVTIDKVSAIIAMTSGTGNSVAPIAAAAHIPAFAMAADPNIGRGEYVYNNFTRPSDDATVWLQEAKNRGIKTIAELTQIQPGINAITDELEKQAPNFGITIVYKERFVSTQSDFKTDIAKARQFNPDMYMVISFPPSLDIIGGQLKTLGIKNVSSVIGFGIALQPSNYEGAWYVDGTMNDQTIIDEFHQKFPGVQFNVTSASGYDSFMMLVKGFESGAPMGQYLTNINEFDGVSGKNVKDVGTNFFHTAPSLWTVKDGKPTFVKILDVK